MDAGPSGADSFEQRPEPGQFIAQLVVNELLDEYGVEERRETMHGLGVHLEGDRIVRQRSVVRDGDRLGN